MNNMTEPTPKTDEILTTEAVEETATETFEEAVSEPAQEASPEDTPAVPNEAEQPEQAMEEQPEVKEPMAQMNDSSSKDQRDKRVLRVIIACLLVIIVILILLLLHDCGCGGRDDGGDPAPTDVSLERDPKAIFGELENMTEEEIQEALNRVVENSMFEVSINPRMVMEHSKSKCDLRILNVPSNYYLMTVKITLDSTGETIYETGAIEPNHYIDIDYLDIEMPVGTNAATAHFTAYDPQTNEEQGGVSVKVSIIVHDYPWNRD